MNPTRETTVPDVADTVSANPGYVLGRLARALHTSQTHADADTRARAERKIATWIGVFGGMLSGDLRIGSRTPLADTPPWATLEVAHGGFATGQLPAGGGRQSHERELLSRLRVPLSDDSSARAALNAYYLSEEGVAELCRVLKSGCYRVTVPEEGALLVVAWLLDHGEPDAARTVLDAIGPFFSQLRFYPVPDPTPLTASSVVHLQNVGDTTRALMAVRDRSEVLAQWEAVRVWAPLFDRVVELFAETVEGPLPSLQTTPDGNLLTDGAERFVADGGWPCQHYPEGWRERASAVLEDYKLLRKEHQRCGGPERAQRNFARLRGYLAMCIRDPRRLTGRDVGLLRVILAGIATKRGLPSSDRGREFRRLQADRTAAPSRVALAKVLTGRLSVMPQDGGLDSLDEVTRPVTPQEAARHGLAANLPVPDSLAAKLRRSLAAPVPALVEEGIIPSAEVLARVIPQITAQVRAAGITDPALRRLYGAIYTAFCKRRSLLLLNLESQVKIGELPWVRAIDPHRHASLDGTEQARQTLEQVVTLAVTAFPEQLLPNKLLQEVRSLAEAAGLKIPLVDELAADIFMGDFSEKFVRAAQTAARLLTGTLYERYYGVPFDRVLRIDDVKASRYGTPASPTFARLCAELAGDGSSGGRSVARNGKIIEQEQILTTHNLAVLFDALGLGEPLRPRLRELAETCFEWVCRKLQQKTDPWQARRRAVKNGAYAWRQMTFFLALLPTDTVAELLGWATEYLEKQRTDFRTRFAPALEGLRAASNLPPTGNGRRFLGWTTEKHWLLG